MDGFIALCHALKEEEEEKDELFFSLRVSLESGDTSNCWKMLSEKMNLHDRGAFWNLTGLLRQP